MMFIEIQLKKAKRLRFAPSVIYTIQKLAIKLVRGYFAFYIFNI